MEQQQRRANQQNWNRQGRYRDWLFTINFPSSEEAFFLLEENYPPQVTFCVWQYEVGESGNFHIQGYMELNNGVKMQTLKNYEFFEAAHFEPRFGTQEQAIAYCSKEESRFVDDGGVEGGTGPFFFGQRKQQGRRSDLIEIRDKIKDQQPMATIANEHFGSFVRYSRGIKEFQVLCSNQGVWSGGIDERFKKNLVFYIGPPGTGKSHRAMHDNLQVGDTYYMKSKGTWWDGYSEQKVIIFDDWYGSHYPFTELLRITDQYPCILQTKGGHVNLSEKTKTFVFTSNQHPKDWYDSEKTHSGEWDPAKNPWCRRVRDFGKIYFTSMLHGIRSVEEVPYNRRYEGVVPAAESARPELVTGQDEVEGMLATGNGAEPPQQRQAVSRS